MIHANLAEAVAVREIRDRVHRLGRDVARHAARRLERHVDDRVARHFVRDHVAPDPAVEAAVRFAQSWRARPCGPRASRTRGGAKYASMRATSSSGTLSTPSFVCSHSWSTSSRNLSMPSWLHDDLDPRLVNVVAAAVHVVHAQDRLDVRQQVLRREPLADRLADVRRAPQTAADEHLEAHLAALVVVHPQADVVDRDRGAIVRRARDRDLELARQVRELGMQERVLAQQLAVDARIGELVLRAARVLVRRDVAHAVARRLDRGDADLAEIGDRVRRLCELDPVVLDVLARREMAEAAVVLARDVRELAHLPRRQRAVRHVHAQHVRMQLEIQPVHQPQRPELVLGELARETARHLAAKLRRALRDELLVELVVSVHLPIPCCSC